MNVHIKFFFILLLLGLNSCFQYEETPDRLMIGYYKSSDNEGVKLLNDSVLVMYLKYNEIEVYDTIKYKYRPPTQDEHVVYVGNVYLKTAINKNSELYKYCQQHSCSGDHLIYTLRYGRYMLLPNPESTAFKYEFVGSDRNSLDKSE